MITITVNVRLTNNTGAYKNKTVLFVLVTLECSYCRPNPVTSVNTQLSLSPQMVVVITPNSYDNAVVGLKQK